VDVQDAVQSIRRAEDQEKAIKKTLAQVQAELDQATARLRHNASQYDRQQQEHRTDLHQLQCKLQDAEALASERAMQLSVITDTVEALQAGTTSERDQCVVTLTTQLVASKGRQAGDERRCRQAEGLAKELQDSCSMLELKNDQLEARCRHAEAETASLNHQLKEVKEELQAACTQLRELQTLEVKLRDEADRSAAARDEAESKAVGLQQALQDATNRHLEEQLSTRVDSQRSRRHDLNTCLSAMPPPAYIKEFREQMNILIQQHEKLTNGTSVLSRLLSFLLILFLAGCIWCCLNF
jgi:chromosome segregation ATPase